MAHHVKSLSLLSFKMHRCRCFPPQFDLSNRFSWFSIFALFGSKKSQTNSNHVVDFLLLSVACLHETSIINLPKHVVYTLPLFFFYWSLRISKLSESSIIPVVTKQWCKTETDRIQYHYKAVLLKMHQNRGPASVYHFFPLFIALTSYVAEVHSFVLFSYIILSCFLWLIVV